MRTFQTIHKQLFRPLLFNSQRSTSQILRTRSVTAQLRSFRSLSPLHLSRTNSKTLKLWPNALNPFKRTSSLQPKKPRRFLRITLIIIADILLIEFAVDYFLFDQVEQRSLRAFGTLARVGLDYKLHEGPTAWFPEKDIESLHTRNAERICRMLKRNGGLYVKFGQAMAGQDGMLPDGYQRMFAALFDDADQMPWSDVEEVIKKDFGCTAEEKFGPNIEHNARASASIAQVHFAKLPDGREVAVKVQKKRIQKQFSWDLWTLKILLGFTEYLTEIPLQKIGEYVMRQMMWETDFKNEARNSERTAALIAADPVLRESVYIPEVYHEFSSKRVLTTEWINGVKLWDKDGISAPLQASGTSSGKTGLGLSLADVMGTVIGLFSAQMFRWGFVHCDPNPGNIFVRRLPSGKPQIVLIDHGLYITLTDDLRRQYARFWKALIVNDQTSLNEVAQQWGMKSAEPWANMLLMQMDKIAEKLDADAQDDPDALIEEMSGFVGEDHLWPQELVLLERNLGLVQGHNQSLGSPVNRIKLIGRHATQALRDDKQYQQLLRQHETLWQSIRNQWIMFALDLAFWYSKVKQYFGLGGGFEDELQAAEERSVKAMKARMV